MHQKKTKKQNASKEDQNTECIKTRQKQTQNEDQEGKWGGGKKARKHRHSFNITVQ